MFGDVPLRAFAFGGFLLLFGGRAPVQAAVLVGLAARGGARLFLARRRRLTISAAIVAKSYFGPIMSSGRTIWSNSSAVT